MALEFGIFDHMERQHGIPLDQQYRERLDLLALADRLGFYGYHLAEHHFAPLSVAPLQPMVRPALTATAATTPRNTCCPLMPLPLSIRVSFTSDSAAQTRRRPTRRARGR